MSTRSLVGILVIVLVFAGVMTAIRSKPAVMPDPRTDGSTQIKPTTPSQTTSPATSGNTSSPVAPVVSAPVLPAKTAAGATIVRYTADGFSPLVIRIKQGESVHFVNTVSKSLKVASDDHPTHAKYPSFEQPKTVGNGGTFDFTFTQKGVWGYHNDGFPSHRGSVIVE